VRLFPHRLLPHWITLKRVMRIGLPSGVESLLVWISQFAVIHIINGMDATNRIPTAHNNAVRIEALSYMGGFAVAAAAATLVGQNLGAKNPARATRAAYLCFALAGAIMTVWGLLFIFFSRTLSGWMSPDPVISQLTAQCLWITGFIQTGFAASIVFSGALRGAGDTVAVMIMNLISIIVIRLAGVWVVVHYLGMGLGGVWVVLSGELFFRGIFMYSRFLHGGWKHIRV
jgi:Na+-driven multidrug efflux pump